MKNTPFLWLLVGLLFIGISIPLVLEKVPRNRWYGFRVPKTFSSERIWYAANRVAGYDLLWSGIVIVITALITGLLLNQLGSTTAHTINLALFIGSLIVAIVHSFWNLNQL
ncbi:MAG: SdpI family protein [Cyanobacteria bacterium P01_G01_bin.49]